MSKIERTRKPRARHKDVVFGAIDERLDIVKTMVLDMVADVTLLPHVTRIEELLDELKRSLGKKEAESDE